MLKTSEWKKSELSSSSSISVCLNSSSAVQGPVTLQPTVGVWCKEYKITWEHDTSPGCPPWTSQAGASGTAWGGTERKVKVVSTLSYHTNSTCWWWATATTPQGWSQSITAGSDLHQPLEAVLGFAVPWATHKGQPGLCCSVFNSPSSARRSVYHWICGTLSRSCLLLLLSLIAVQSLTRKTPFFCCTWGTSYCGGLTLAGHQVSYQSCPIPLLSWAGQRKSNKKSSHGQPTDKKRSLTSYTVMGETDLGKVHVLYC